MPDLFSGSSLVILGLYKGKGKTKITLSGKIKEKIHNYNYDVHFTTNDSKNDFIPPLWAARRIGYLLDQIRLHGEDKELIDEITELARNHGIITPYTSFLILEDERKRVSVRELNDDHQTLGGIAPNAPVLTAKSKKEYYNMKKKSGKGSIQASEEFQALNKAENSAQTRQGNSRLNYRNNKGRIVNINKQIKNIQGRAIYNTGKYWVDSRLQYEKINKVVRIQFGSKKYFNLLRKNLLSAKFLALGKNVKFIINDTSYEIFE